MASKNNKQTAQEQKKEKNPMLYWGTIVILIITVLAFVIAPMFGTGASMGNDFSLGSWDGKSISVVQGGLFLNQVQQVKSQYESMGSNISDNPNYGYFIWKQAFNNCVSYYAMLDYANKAGISVTEDYLNKKMAEQSIFQENGVFSKRKYREVSESEKASIRKNIKETYLQRTYVNDVTSISISDAETAFLKEMAAAKRAIKYVAFPFSAYPADKLQSFAQANKDKFRSIKLSKITVNSSASEAEQILAKIKAGEISFEDAAKNHSKDNYAAKGGDYGTKYGYDLKSDFKNEADAEELFSLKKGDYSKVYETYFDSWAFYRIDEEAKDADLASENFNTTVYNYMSRNEKGLLEDYAIARANEFKTKAAVVSDFQTAFDSVALADSLVVKKTSSFPLNYGDALEIPYYGISLLGKIDTKDLPELQGASTNENFLTKAFSLKPAEVSDAIIMNDNAIIMTLDTVEENQENEETYLESFFPMIVQQNLSSDFNSAIQKSPLLKDNFDQAYSKLLASNN